MNLKNLLKSLRMNESTISMVLGALVVIVVGYLVVNYFRSQTTPEEISVPGETTTQEQKETPAEAEFKGTLPTTHKVERGENLWTIAEHYYGSGYNWVDIAQENKLSQPNLLAAGQELTIPAVPAKQSTIDQLPSTGISDQVQVENPIEGTTYTIQKGDNLWEIAVRAYGDGYRWVDLAKANQLENPNIIHPGNELQIPR